MRFEPTPFHDRPETAQAILGAVVPAVVGGVAGVLIGASAGAYWVVAVLAGVGAFLGGFEHRDGWDAADRGFLGGVAYGTALLLVHTLINDPLKVSLGSFPPFLVLITAIAGALLSAGGGHLSRVQHRRVDPARRQAL
jgi:hypothetical protein